MVENKPSHEQQKGLEYLKKGFNLQVNAIAGSGKTTFALNIIKLFPNAKILILSYNTDLVESTNDRIDEADKSRVLVSTYHSLLSSLSKKNIHNDSYFMETLEHLSWEEVKKTWKFANYDIIIQDESQDVKLPFFILAYLLNYKVCHHRNQLKIVVLGHDLQLLYDFYSVNRADVRFLTHIDILYRGITPRAWKKLEFTQSFRSPEPIANVLNALNPCLKTVPKPNPNHIKQLPVLWLVCDLKLDLPHLVLPIAQKYKDKLMVFYPYLTENSPAIRMVDVLLEHDIPVHVGRSGNISESSSKINTKNKLRVKTKHSGKGLECDAGIVILDYRCNIFNDMKNVDYVACSRPKEFLMVIQDHKSTTRKELEHFVSKLKQKDIRLIVYREPPMNIKNRYETESLVPKNGFVVKNFFSYFDVEHMKILSNYVQTQTIEKVCFEEDDEEYWQNMNITFDEGQTYVDVTHIIELALKFAMEFSITKSVPVIINKIIQDQNNKTQRYTKYKTKIQILVYDLKPLSGKNIDEIFEHFPLFAKFATYVDAYHSYNEKELMIHSFDFINRPDIYNRFRCLMKNMSFLVEKYQSMEWVWFKQDNFHFTYGNLKLTMHIEPHLFLKEKKSDSPNILVQFYHNPDIQEDQRLTSLLTSQIFGSQQTITYIINIATGSMECLSLFDKYSCILPPFPPKLYEEIKCKEKNEITLTKNNSQNQGSLDFIEKCIFYKLYKEENLNDQEFFQKCYESVSCFLQK